MKKLILLAAIACLVQIAIAQKKGVLLSEMGLKGPIKEVFVYEYTGRANDVSTDNTHWSPKTKIEFDKYGNELAEYDYDSNSKIQSRFLFDYKGDKTIVKSQFVDSDKLVCTYTSKYDDKGNTIEFDSKSEGYRNMNAFEDKMIYKYDKKGNLTKIIQNVVSNKTISLNKTFLYDEKNQMIESDNYDLNGKLLSKEVFGYDSLGRVVKTDVFDKNGKIEFGKVLSYDLIDNHGNWIAMTTENKNQIKIQGNNLFKSFTRRYIKYY